MFPSCPFYYPATFFLKLDMLTNNQFPDKKKFKIARRFSPETILYLIIYSIEKQVFEFDKMRKILKNLQKQDYQYIIYNDARVKVVESAYNHR